MSDAEKIQALIAAMGVKAFLRSLGSALEAHMETELSDVVDGEVMDVAGELIDQVAAATHSW